MALTDKSSGNGDDDDGGSCDPAAYSTTARTVVTRKPWVPTPLPPQDSNDVADSSKAPPSSGKTDRMTGSDMREDPYVMISSGGSGGVCVKPNEPNPDPSDCAKFYLCANGVPHPM